MRKILIATRNKGKLPELKKLLEGTPFEVLGMEDVDTIPKDYEVEEPAMTFEGNAIIKAVTLGNKTGLLVLADDSGLEVDALGGKPGVYSARYAPGTDEDRNHKILEELKNIAQEDRSARFKAVIAIYDPETEKLRTCEGVCEGRITEEFKGENGFGYDPIFFSEELGKTTAEATLEEKNRISHRGKALKLARQILEKEFV